MFRQFYTHEGIEKTTYFFFENQFTGAYISCITEKPSKVTIQALSDAKIIAFPYKVLSDLYKKEMIWQTFGRIMAEYIANGLEERMAELLMYSAEERYLQLIKSNKTKILERIPQQYIANYLGITPVSMSRIRNRMAKK